MKKESTHDYALEMFLAYARAGRRTYEQERLGIYNAALERYSQLDSATAVIKAEEEVNKQYSYLADIAAVEKTFEILRAGGRGMIADAAEKIYCLGYRRQISHKEISGRVKRYAMSCPTDISNIYRWLKYARLLCASLRGLSIPQKERERYGIGTNAERILSVGTTWDKK